MPPRRNNRLTSLLAASDELDDAASLLALRQPTRTLESLLGNAPPPSSAQRASLRQGETGLGRHLRPSSPTASSGGQPSTAASLSDQLARIQQSTSTPISKAGLKQIRARNKNHIMTKLQADLLRRQADHLRRKADELQRQVDQARAGIQPSATTSPISKSTLKQIRARNQRHIMTKMQANHLRRRAGELQSLSTTLQRQVDQQRASLPRATNQARKSPARARQSPARANNQANRQLRANQLRRQRLAINYQHMARVLWDAHVQSTRAEYAGYVKQTLSHKQKNLLNLLKDNRLIARIHGQKRTVKPYTDAERAAVRNFINNNDNYPVLEAVLRA